jgi:hypothetical protein
VRRDGGVGRIQCGIERRQQIPQGRDDGLERRRHGDRRQAARERGGAPGGDGNPLTPQEAAQHEEVARARVDQRLADDQGRAQLPPRRGQPMRGAVGPEPIGIRQRVRVAYIGA